MRHLVLIPVYFLIAVYAVYGVYLSGYYRGQLDCQQAYNYPMPGWELPPTR